MTQASLSFEAIGTPGTRLRGVYDLLSARRGQWVDGRELAKVGGYAAWRTRVSDLRRLYGLTVENRESRRTLTSGETVAVSEYRLL